MSCSLVDTCQCFGETCCFHYQGIRIVVYPEYGASIFSEAFEPIYKITRYHISHVAIYVYIIPFHMYSVRYKDLLAKKRFRISYIVDLWF
jgi:hypothetical protein